MKASCNGGPEEGEGAGLPVGIVPELGLVDKEGGTGQKLALAHLQHQDGGRLHQLAAGLALAQQARQEAQCLPQDLVSRGEWKKPSTNLSSWGWACIQLIA